MLLRAQIARFFLARFQAQPRNEEQLCQAVRHLMLPLLEHAFAQTPPEPVLEASTVQGMVAHMFDPPEEQAGEVLLPTFLETCQKTPQNTLEHAFAQTPPEPVLEASTVQGMVAHMFDPPEEQAGEVLMSGVRA